MQLEFSDEQRMIRDSALDWLGANYDFRGREPSLYRDGGSPGVWSAFAEMGWLGLPLPERVGGLEGGLLESCLLMHTLGQFLVVEPFHACVLQAARLLALTGTLAQQDSWLPGVAAGEHRLTLAHGEAGDALPWAARTTVARRSGRGWVIDGAKRGVTSAPGAVRLIVSAQAADDGKTCLFLVDPGVDGVSIDAYDTTDGGRAADIGFAGVSVNLDACLSMGDEADARRHLHGALAEGLISDCWYAVGAMQAAFRQTADYVQQRRQFGQPLSGLQVVQHRIAEMTVLCAEAQAACELAALRTVRDAGAGPGAASMARNKVARAALYVSRQCVQLHGAMGVCEELPIAATFRALTAFCHRGGDSDAHATAYGHELLATGAFANSQILHDQPSPAGQESRWT